VSSVSALSSLSAALKSVSRWASSSDKISVPVFSVSMAIYNAKSISNLQWKSIKEFKLINLICSREACWSSF
jgi:hypothetical protein